MTIGDYIKTSLKLPAKTIAIVAESDKSYEVVNHYGSIFRVYKTGWILSTEKEWLEDSNDYAKAKLLAVRRSHGK